MKMVFVADTTLQKYFKERVRENSKDNFKESNAVDGDILLFDYTALQEVNYRSELNGEMHKLEELAIYSKRFATVIVAGCYTNSHGLLRKSTVVADNGKILGVADMIYTQEESDYCGGAHMKVYDTHAGKVGILVAEDIFYPHLAQTLSLCDADYIVCIFEEIIDTLPTLMLRASAFTSGVNIIMRAAGVVQIAAPNGEIIYRTSKKLDSYNLDIRREYQLLTTRGRGYLQHNVKDY